MEFYTLFTPFRVLKLLVFIISCLRFTINTQAGQWQDGRATFYTNAGGYACGYNTNAQGYGDEVSAVSAPLFSNGAMCGACYQLICVNSPNCYKAARSIKVTVTDFCPSTNDGKTPPWCNPPQKHFDLSIPMFTKIAPYNAGIVPVKFRRVRCYKTGGVRFKVHPMTNKWWLQILVHNVGGGGIVSDVRIKGSKSGWIQMSRNWGQNWDVHSELYGQRLSFQVTLSGGRTLVFNGVVPSYWGNGQTFVGKINF